ncbi:hypothetical protein ABPG72_002946 [Tetrahymena utriculariae]
MGNCSTKERKNKPKNVLEDNNKNNLTQKEQSKIKNLQEQQEANLEQIQGQQKEYPSQKNKEFLQSYKIQNMKPKNDQNVQQFNDQEVQEFKAKFKYQNNFQDEQLTIKQQTKNLTFEQTACGIHKDKGQHLAFLNGGSNASQKLIYYICLFEQQIQQKNVFMLDQFFKISEKEYIKNFLKFEQDESREIYEKLFDMNYGQQYSKKRVVQQYSKLQTQAQRIQNQLDQIIGITRLNNLEFLKDFISSNEIFIINYPKELENLTYFKNSSQIIQLEESEMIKKWIGSPFVSFKKIYTATQDGFQIENIIQKCQNKRKIMLLIKTIQNKRFGFYTDLEIKNYDGKFVAQNPNNIFLFSLDLNLKYTSNEPNCKYAFCSNDSYLAVGGGHDIFLYSNSNSQKNSYVNCLNYGQKEGLTGHALNGGAKNFITSEIEIFEVIEA